MILGSKARWALSIALALFITVVPTVYYRMVYTHQKRLRVVTAGRFYRAGCMSAAGLEDAIKKFGIRTVVNFMDEAPDPYLHPHYFAPRSVLESELVARLGARYVAMTVDVVPRRRDLVERPKALAQYFEILDDPASYPVLVHCKAGLHRTGVMVAVYRMEYEGWTPQQAMAELKSNGFGEFTSTASNVYIQQYVLLHQPRRRTGPGRAPGAAPPATLTSRPNAAAAKD